MPKKILKTNPWTLGQAVEFTEVLVRGNSVEYDKPATHDSYGFPAYKKQSDELELDWFPQYRRGRIYNRWTRLRRPLQQGVLVRLTQRRDTEVIRGYEGEGNYGRVLKSHHVALVAVDLRLDLVTVPLDNLRAAGGVEEDSET